MSESVISVIVEDFESASRRARRIANRFMECASVVRTPSGWAVLSSNDVLDALTASRIVTSEDFDSHGHDSHESDYEREVLQEMVEELESDRDSYALSDEEGWFHKD